MILNYDESFLIRYLKGITGEVTGIPSSDCAQLADKVVELYKRLLNAEHEKTILLNKFEPSEPMQRSGVGAS
jgi:hypothetical protein